MTTTRSNTVRMIRLACCVLVLAGVAAQVDAKKTKRAPAKRAAASKVDPAVASGHDRAGAATFQALPKLAPVSDPAAQTSGTSAANQAQIMRQAAYDAAAQARQSKINADLAAYERREQAYKQVMEAWNKQVAACKAGNVSQCSPPVVLTK